MIPVSKPYLPSRKKLDSYIDAIYKSNRLTNSGPLVQELTNRLADYIGVDSKCITLVANGSLALQLAYKALDLKGDVLTTPFTFIATASTLKWEGLRPIFSDIDPLTWNLDPHLLRDKLTASTSAILPVHVFGNPCDITGIQSFAERHDLRVVYDASHCFGVTLKGDSILKFGDISTISFHATKIFHSVEGGAVVSNNPDLAEKIRQMASFGMDYNGSIRRVGSNAKMSELHAAVGLAVLDEIDVIEIERKRIWQAYDKALGSKFRLQRWQDGAVCNYAYFPVLMNYESQVLRAIEELYMGGVQARRYFHPSLDTIGFMGVDSVAPVSLDISKRILCLPIYPGLDEPAVNRIINIIRRGDCF